MSKKLYYLVFALCSGIFAGPVVANKTLPLDVVVIMDSSGSMKKTDPKELRKPAAKLFITLLGKEDRLSVMSFSDNAYPITFLNPLDSDKNKTRSIEATDKISSKGIYTNIHAAIARGIDMLKDSHAKNRDPIIVLMSDGKMDVGNAGLSAELRTKIQQELTPLLKQYKIKIFSIAFTEESDQTLLQEIADATDGRYALAASDDVLHRVFTKMFEQSKEPNMLPLFENQFVVDPSIREITIIANKKAETSKIFLETPSGKRINSTFKSETLKWFVSTGFDMITLTKPEEGTWKILFSDDDNKAYIVADIKLRTEFEYKTDTPTPELLIKSWFIQNDELVSKNELLSSMEVTLEIEHPDGKLEQQAVDASNEDGMFMTSFTPTMNGIYSAAVIAESKTFQRQQVFSFRASIPEQVAAEAVPALEAEPESLPPVITEQPVDMEPPQEDDFGNALFIFLLVNIVLVFIGANVFLIMKLNKNKKQKDKAN
ncbi:MAG TPA: VWA domain-containing protein [Gammaproteobacteria bacterium]